MFKHVVGFRFSLSIVMVCASTGSISAIASESVDERVRLSLLLRQLDALERQAEHGEALPDRSSVRFHFSYTRLREDLHRIRSGIHDYLTPQRAQPRDPAPLHGHYREEVMFTP